MGWPACGCGVSVRMLRRVVVQIFRRGVVASRFSLFFSVVVLWFVLTIFNGVFSGWCFISILFRRSGCSGREKISFLGVHS